MIILHLINKYVSKADLSVLMAIKFRIVVEYLSLLIEIHLTKLSHFLEPILYCVGWCMWWLVPPSRYWACVHNGTVIMLTSTEAGQVGHDTSLIIEYKLQKYLKRCVNLLPAETLQFYIFAMIENLNFTLTILFPHTQELTWHFIFQDIINGYQIWY